MTGAPTGGNPTGYLEFFILEAGEYVEQLDRLLLHATTAGGLDGRGVQRVARALRGTATMAKLNAFADLAAAIERVGRALHQGALSWDPGLHGALVAAVDDLKILVRGARTWSAAEEQRAATRTGELTRYAPVQSTSETAGAPAAAPASYLASEASNVAAGLELLAARPGDVDTAANVLRRVRALRGVAGIKEVEPLAEALEATEDAARGLELGEELSAEGRRLLEAASAYLRMLARAMRGDTGSDVHGPSATRDAFAAALENWSNRMTEGEQVIPIAELFYEGAHGLVESSTNPPTSSSERFRIELVSLGEHLGQVVSAARAARDTGATVRARRDLKRVVRDAQSTAQSFGETEIAAFIESHLESAEHVDFLGLAALQDLADSLADAGAGGSRLKARASELAERRELAASIATGLGAELPAPEATAPVASPTPRAVSPLAIATPVYTPAIESTPTPPTPTATPVIAPTPAVATAESAAELPTHALDSTSAALIHSSVSALDNPSTALIDSTIAAIDALNEHPFLEPSPLPEDALVPIDTLLYRGRAALDRAIELRDEIRARTGGPSRDALNELFDLLELARAE
jgi:chemotaxis protein histidine kinase CheA